MATVTSTWIESFGSLTLNIVKFSDLDDDDTYDTGIPSIVGYWFQQTDNATDAQFGIAASESKGVITVYTDEDDRTAILYILSKS